MRQKPKHSINLDSHLLLMNTQQLDITEVRKCTPKHRLPQTTELDLFMLARHDFDGIEESVLKKD